MQSLPVYTDTVPWLCGTMPLQVSLLRKQLKQHTCGPPSQCNSSIYCLLPAVMIFLIVIFNCRTIRGNQHESIGCKVSSVCQDFGSEAFCVCVDSVFNTFIHYIVFLAHEQWWHVLWFATLTTLALKLGVLFLVIGFISLVDDKQRKFLNYCRSISQFHNHAQLLNVKNSGRPLDNQTCSFHESAVVSEWKPNFGSFCCGQPIVCHVWWSSGHQNCLLVATAHDWETGLSWRKLLLFWG